MCIIYPLLLRKVESNGNLCILIIVLFFVHADLFPRHASVPDDLLSSTVRFPQHIVSNVALRPLIELNQEPCRCCSLNSICPILSSLCLSKKTMDYAFAPPRSFRSRLRFAHLVLGWAAGVQRTAKQSGSQKEH